MLVVVISLVESDGIRSLYMLPIYPIYSLPHGPGERLTALGANVAPNGGRHPASGACLLDRVLLRRPELPQPGVAPQGISGCSGVFPGSPHHLEVMLMLLKITINLKHYPGQGSSSFTYCF